MQEEVEQKTMALSVRTARFTAELLQKAFRQFFEAQKNKPQEFKQGKQTLKELMKQNTNISSIEITHDNIKDFEGTAKKYGDGCSAVKKMRSTAGKQLKIRGFSIFGHKLER